MRTIEITLPDDLEKGVAKHKENQQEFIIEAIREKLEKENVDEALLIEGYQKTVTEDSEIAEDFKHIDLEDW
jgi:hypothetical protein